MARVKFAGVVLTLVIWGLGIGAASAATITLDHGDLYATEYYGVGTMGSGRGVGFEVNTGFQLNSLGLDLGVPDPTSELFQFQIYSSVDGHSAGALLASTQFSVAEGEGFQDFPFVFAFSSGLFYVINFTGVNGTLPGEFGTMYSWEPSAHFNYGVLSVVEGFEGNFPNAGNPLVAHFRLNIDQQPTEVPEPATLVLVGLGVAGGRRLLRKNRLA